MGPGVQEGAEPPLQTHPDWQSFELAHDVAHCPFTQRAPMHSASEEHPPIVFVALVDGAGDVCVHEYPSHE